MLPPGMTFAALPTVSAPVAHGLQIVRSGVDAPRIEGIGDRFSFKLQTSSSGGPAVLLVSGISVIVQPGFVPGTHFTSVDGSGVSQNAVNNVMVASESTTPSLSSVSNATVGRGADDFTIVLSGINFGPGATVTFKRNGVLATDITRRQHHRRQQLADHDQGRRRRHRDARAARRDRHAIPAAGSITVASGLSITAAPTITGVTPTPVLRTGLRQSVRLAGTGFQAPTQSPPNIGATISGTGITIEGVGFNSAQEIVLDVVVAVDAPTDRSHGHRHQPGRRRRYQRRDRHARRSDDHRHRRARPAQPAHAAAAATDDHVDQLPERPPGHADPDYRYRLQYHRGRGHGDLHGRRRLQGDGHRQLGDRH